ncbi:carboxypeptidase-like regulatory domain-containing protein [Ancylomarina longa]|nr:carboxypeptidase-like regulatory domain-containing protein [Ancylomarina longa]
MKFKKYILLVSCLLSVLSLFGENFDIKGIVKDSKTNQFIPYANIIVLNRDSTFVCGTITNEKGLFHLNRPASAEFLLSISSVGYAKQLINLKGMTKKIDLGVLALNPNTEKLDEVTVHADNRRIDKQLYFPTKEIKAKSTNGLQITQRLMLPEIIVSEKSGTISLGGSKELKLLINGIEATSQEVLALNPKEILRVDYYDNPGLRYGDNIGAIIDYKTKRITSGGYMLANLTESLTHESGYGQASGGFNFKKSQLKFNYLVNHHAIHSLALKNQNYNYPDGNNILRIEKTNDYHWREIYQNANISYNYSGKKDMFNIKMNLFELNHPHIDSDNEITTTEANEIIQNNIRENTQTLRPSLDLYYFKQLRNKQSFAINLVGTYGKNKIDYNYFEFLKENELYRIISNVDGQRQSLIGEVFYEKQLSLGTITAGVKHTQGNTTNEYRGSTSYTTRMDDASTYGFIQYKGSWGKLGYMGAFGLARDYFSQQGQDDYIKWSLTPKISLNYKFDKTYSLRCSSQLSSIDPELSYLSDVELPVNKYQSIIGNPELKTYLSYQNELKFSINKSSVRTSLSLTSYLYKNPIMEETYFDEAKQLFIRSYNNQKSFHNLKAQWNVGASFIDEHLSINGYVGYNHEASKGNDYAHYRNSLYYVIQMIADYEKFTFTFTSVQLPHPFWGETVSVRNSYNEYNLTYKVPWGQVGVSSTNLFGEKSESHSYDYNSMVADKTIIYNKQYPSFELYLSFNLDWGKQYKSRGKNLDNSDSSDGVLQK